MNAGIGWGWKMRGGGQKVWVEGCNEEITSLRLAMFENTLFYNQF